MARYDTAVGKYVYVTVDDLEYRVYFEESGSGIPLMLQHTAGSDAREWRHLLENPDITDNYRVIAYDLPYHGKSLPPLGKEYWKEEYRLERDFFMKFILALKKELELDKPVFMGCSMGGQICIDLSIFHPEEFRSLVAVEASIKSPGFYLDMYYHPRVSNEAKPATMYGLCSPTSPEKYIRETVWTYSQGAPVVFKGDLYYYSAEYDVTDTVDRIDTSKTPLYMLTGEYDWATSPAMSQELADRIPGVKYTEMNDIGHFGMMENPEVFMHFVVPVLHEIAGVNVPLREAGE